MLVDAQISGRARLFETFSDDTLWIVLEQTQFGLIFQLRGVSAALLIWIVLSRRNAHATRRPVLSILSVSVAVFYIGTIAWTGHAGASPGRLGYFHLTSDFLHLVTAGAWLGEVAPLAITLYRLRQSSERVVAIYGLVQRFSDFGVAVVAILLASGVVNAWFLLGSVHALIGTEYGRLLMVKIALFVAMVSLAALNRLIFVPENTPVLQNEGQSNSDAKRLQRIIGAELCLGMAIIFVVGILGTMAPAAPPSVTYPLTARCRLLCRFSDAGMTRLSTRSDGRRPKSAKARNRGMWGTGGAAGAMGILPRGRASAGFERSGCGDRLFASQAWLWYRCERADCTLPDGICGATAAQSERDDASLTLPAESQQEMASVVAVVDRW